MSFYNVNCRIKSKRSFPRVLTISIFWTVYFLFLFRTCWWLYFELHFFFSFQFATPKRVNIYILYFLHITYICSQQNKLLVSWKQQPNSQFQCNKANSLTSFHLFMKAVVFTCSFISKIDNVSFHFSGRADSKFVWNLCKYLHGSMCQCCLLHLTDYNRFIYCMSVSTFWIVEYKLQRCRETESEITLAVCFTNLHPSWHEVAADDWNENEQ